jgi:hypothetical protein
MICHPHPTQLASILQPTGGHCKCDMRIAVTIPGAEAHIFVPSQNEIHMMINYFTDDTQANSDKVQCLEPTILQRM